MITRHCRFAYLALAVFVCLFVAQHAQAITILASKALPDNSPVTLDNVVITNIIDTINSGAAAAFHVQDGTGGVTVFGPNLDIAGILGALVPGDQLTISGTTDSFNGLYELIGPFALGPVTLGVGVPAPDAITVATMQALSAGAELSESRLVRLSNVTFVAPPAAFTANSNFTVTDGLLNATVRVSTSFSSLIGDPIPVGPVNITGILSQFDPGAPAPGVPGVGYQLLLLDDSSVRLVPEPAGGLLAGLLAIVASVRIRRGQSF